jgi:glycosyltransferase involved in cell wall biosynthesis
VIIAVHNTASHLKEAVYSALDSVGVNVKVIIVDDASTDGSAEIASEISNSDSRVTSILNKKNMGAYFCRNIGILNSKTEFLAFLDSDDIQTQDRLIRQIIPLLEDPFLKATYSSARRWEDNFTKPIRDLGLGFISVVFRKELIEQIGFFDSVRFAGDAEFRARLIEWFSRFAIKDLGDELYKLRFRNDSLTSSGIGAILTQGNEGMLIFSNSHARDAYQANFTTWHQSGMNLYMPFPLKERPFATGHPDQSITSDLL